MDLHFKSAAEIARLIRQRKISAVETLEHFLARVEKYDPRLNAIVWLDVAQARKRAQAADAALAKGEIWGPLHGVPMTIKESYNVAGSPTTWGDPNLKNNIRKQAHSRLSGWKSPASCCSARPTCRCCSPMENCRDLTDQ